MESSLRETGVGFFIGLEFVGVGRKVSQIGDYIRKPDFESG
jgi:hypothetical protein